MDVVETIRKRQRLVLSLFVVIVVPAALATVLRRPNVIATGRVQVPNGSPKEMLAEEAELLRSTSRQAIELVARASVPPERLPQLDRITEGLMHKFEVTTDSADGTLIVQQRSASPDIAERIVNGVLDAYVPSRPAGKVRSFQRPTPPLPVEGTNWSPLWLAVCVGLVVGIGGALLSEAMGR